MADETALLLRQDHAGIARLTLNRPGARNALGIPLMTALEHAWPASPPTPRSASSCSPAPARPSAPGTT